LAFQQRRGWPEPSFHGHPTAPNRFPLRKSSFFLEPIKRAVFGPRSKSVVHGLPPIPVGQILRRSPGAQNPEKAVEDLLMILVPAPATFYLWQQVLDLFKLFVGEFEASASHPESRDR